MSSRSLQRRLADEGLSWKQLVEDTRKMLVERHLRTPGMTVAQMAFLLGFSEVSAVQEMVRGAAESVSVKVCLIIKLQDMGYR